MKHGFVMIGLAVLMAGGCARVSEDAWHGDWDITANAVEANVDQAGYLPFGWHEGEIGPEVVNRPPYEGKGSHVGLAVLHPISIREPARLRYRSTIPQASSVLSVTAAGHVLGDTVLRCQVGDQVVGEYVLDGLSWKTFTFDLTSYQHLSAPLELHIAAGGAEPWRFEHGFIDRIEFLGR